jgi:citrate lyase subunit alpha/citrate CoA-transferase
VTTLCGPGELIDVVVTERGIAVNPRHRDLLEALRGTSLPLRSIQKPRAEAEAICRRAPASPALGDRVIGVVTWVDGTLIDSIREVASSR